MPVTSEVLIDSSWRLYVPGQTIYYNFLDLFPTADYVFANDDERARYLTGFTTFSADQRAAVHKVLEIISQLTNLSFVEITNPGAADIRFGNTSMWLDGAINFRAQPGDVGPRRINDVFISNYPTRSNTDTTIGGYGLTSLLHEIGHALGLKHPHEGSPSSLSVTRELSVMSNGDTPYGAPSLYGSTPLVFDVAALQSMYGANAAWNNTDTEYIFNPNPNNSIASGGLHPLVIFRGQRRAIWDGGGTDKLWADNYTTRVEIDLRGGMLSSVGGIRNIAIAEGVQIEQAVGGTASDLLVGNDAPNNLKGGLGADVLEGGQGADVYLYDRVAGEGADIIRDSDGQGSIEVAGVALGANLTRLSNTVWKDTRGYVYYYESGLLQIIDTAAPGGAAHAIRVEGYQSGQLGMTFGGTSIQPDQTVLGGAGDDSLWDVVASNDLILGGAGKDYLFNPLTTYLNAVGQYPWANDGEDLFYGEAGDDLINAGDETDYVDGGADNDVLAGGWGMDILVGGDGRDVLAGDAQFIPTGSWSVDFLPDATVFHNIGGSFVLSWHDAQGNPFPGVQPNGPDALYGGAGDDRLWGGEGDDLLDGGTENDWLQGLSESDVLLGGDGDDLIWGDSSQDPAHPTWVYTLPEYHGDDYADGGAGNDFITGDGGADTLYGGSGADTIVGDASTLAEEWHGADWLDGGDGDDTIYGYGKGDTIFGGAGADNLYGDSDTVPWDKHGADYLDGGDGNDQISGDGGADTLVGGPGDDSLFGDADNVPVAYRGDDFLDGGDGNDYLRAYEGNDTLIGGAGDDELLAEAGDDWLDGGDGIDVLDGGDGTDALYGGAGADELYGGDGADVLDGGDGADLLAGQAGHDRYILSANDFDTIVETEGTNSLDVAGFYDPASLYLSVRTTAQSQQYLTTEFAPDLRVELADGPQGFVSEYSFADGSVLAHRDLFAQGLYQALSASVATATGGTLYGGRNADTLAGSNGADLIEGAGGADSIRGYAGADTLRGGDGDDVLEGDLDDDTLEGGAGDDKLYGHTSMFVTAGADILVGGQGRDELWGGQGDDVYRYSRGDGFDRIIEWLNDSGSSTDRLELATGILTSQVTLYRTRDAFDFYGTDDDLLVVLDGGADQILIDRYFAPAEHGDWLLEQIAFADGTVWQLSDVLSRVITVGTPNGMTGTSGNDVFIVDHTQDAITSAGAGVDTVQSSVDYTLAASDLENLTLTGSFDIAGTGNSGNNVIQGNAGHNTLNGGGGVDTLYGGAGDDWYGIDLGSTVVENPGEGTDTVRVSFAYTLPTNVENVILNSSSGSTIALTGNALPNVMIGRSNPVQFVSSVTGDIVGTDVIDGGAGADVLTGYSGVTFRVDDPSDQVLLRPTASGFQTIVESSISYRLLPGIEILKLTGTTATTGTGNELNNRLDGSLNPAVNILIGQDGSDLYILGTGDSIVETATGGTDTARITFRTTSDPLQLSVINASDYANVEWIELAESAGLSKLIGDGQTNYLVANRAGSVLEGGGAADYLYGNVGIDTLDGGAGADAMSGGALSDTYYVDDAGDVIYEDSIYWDPQLQQTKPGGTDTVYASASYTLPTNVEALILTGTSAISGTGNDQANELDGRQNSAANVLAGGLGNDTYHLGAGDSILEAPNGGSDSVFSDVSLVLAWDNVETVYLSGTGNIDATGNAQDNSMWGNSGNNVIQGAAGNDLLNASDGFDVLDGGLGNDTYQIFSNLTGQTTISSTDATAVKLDVVQFSAYSSQVGFVRTGNDLLFQQRWFAETGEVIHRTVIQNYYAATTPTRIEQFVFGDSVVLTPADIAARVIQGTAGADTLTGTASADGITGLGGNDTINAGSGDDLVYGGDGQDTLNGQAGADELWGEAGDDRLDGGADADRLYGGPGNDTYVTDGSDNAYRVCR